MIRTLQLLQRCASLKPSKGFQAVYNTELQSEIINTANPKLDALVDVVLSLNNMEAEYLNCLLT